MNEELRLMDAELRLMGYKNIELAFFALYGVLLLYKLVCTCGLHCEQSYCPLIAYPDCIMRKCGMLRLIGDVLWLMYDSKVVHQLQLTIFFSIQCVISHQSQLRVHQSQHLSYISFLPQSSTRGVMVQHVNHLLIDSRIRKMKH